LATSNHTGNYNLSHYAAGDSVEFLTNYNQDMAAIDTALKAIHDSDAAKTPLSRTIAGLPLSADLTVAQLIAAGLCPAPVSGTWTPTLYGDTTAGSPTYTARDGYFYKIGKLVAVYFMVQLSAKGGMAGNVSVGGLPFAGTAYGCGSVLIPASSGFTLPTGGAGLFGSVNPSGIELLYGGPSYNGKLTADMLSDSFILYSHAAGHYISAA
jgi:hypothetical protein